jgi:mono/diheme cytochrome c family protein
MMKQATRSTVLVFALLFSVSAVAIAQEAAKKTVKKEPIKSSSPASGKEMFEQYCAACHGKEGTGNGPAASVFKTPPTDLSTLSKRNSGKFPEDHVASVLRFGVKTPAHGSSDMPTWGPLFSTVSGSSAAVVQLRISNLIHYLETLQKK